MKIETVEIDVDKLCEAIKECGKAQDAFSVEMGKNKNYIYGLRKTRKCGKNVADLMAILLGREPGEFEKRCESPAAPSVSENVLAMIDRDIRGLLALLKPLSAKIEQMEEAQEKLMRKSNANTVQLEKIKECLDEMTQGEYQRARNFLQDILKNGEVNGQEIFRRADDLCIKRGELMKAKAELGVMIVNRGNGRNEKPYWRLDSL